MKIITKWCHGGAVSNIPSAQIHTLTRSPLVLLGFHSTLQPPPTKHARWLIKELKLPYDRSCMFEVHVMYLVFHLGLIPASHKLNQSKPGPK